MGYAPSRVLTSEEKDLIWKYCSDLIQDRDKCGLTKLIKSVAWLDPMEVKEAMGELLPMCADIGPDDALEFLGPRIVDSRMRAFAVKQLARADDDVSVIISRTTGSTLT
jgi:phosphatidylinositol 3-kinase